jgi:uncharacterized glyoxalase superfamily metalloenzyme YdcJ
MLLDTEYVSATEIRHEFAAAMSDVYQKEVQLYQDLLSLVTMVNQATLLLNKDLKANLEYSGQLERLHLERHGAIRVGTAQEIRDMARFLNIMGMRPVGYYDLSIAGLPIHATCFRCLDLESLNQNPFRLFVSVLRQNFLTSNKHRTCNIAEALSRRNIFHPRVRELVSLAERTGGKLTRPQASEFITLGLETFKWGSTATVSKEIYQALHDENPLVADIVAFSGPHINHLTPRTLDIDVVHARMREFGIQPKETIEGPPARKCPILLRQTSFKALTEKIYFPARHAGAVLGSHAARFGEVEERGAALTVKGRKLYDELVVEVLMMGISPNDTAAYEVIFSRFPDDWEEMRKAELVWFRYYVADLGRVRKTSSDLSGPSAFEDAIECRAVRFDPSPMRTFCRCQLLESSEAIWETAGEKSPRTRIVAKQAIEQNWRMLLGSR